MCEFTLNRSPPFIPTQPTIKYRRCNFRLKIKADSVGLLLRLEIEGVLLAWKYTDILGNCKGYADDFSRSGSAE